MKLKMGLLVLTIVSFFLTSWAQQEVEEVLPTIKTKKSDDNSNSDKKEKSFINDNSANENLGSADSPIVEKTKSSGRLSDSLEEIGTYRTKQFINLTLGFEQDIKLPALPATHEFKGDFRKIASVSISKELGVLRFNPREEGFGTLIIRDKKTGKTIAEYQIDVRKSKLEKVVREVRSLLGDIEGIQIKVVNNRVTIDGQILLPRDMSRIYAVSKQFGDQVAIIVSMSPLAMKKIAEFISRDINNPEVEVRAINNKFLITGWVSGDKEIQRALDICELYMPDAIMDQAEAEGIVKKRKPLCAHHLEVKEGAPPPPKKMIQLVVHFVELKKDYSKSFKFEWRPTISDQTGLQFTVGQNSNGSSTITQLTGVISNLLPKLNWAKEHGHARVLESTSLIVEEGKKGEISQESSIPYSVIGQSGTQGTAFANVGLKSGITAQISDQKTGTVALDMSFALSTLLGYGAGGAPITSSNNITTAISVRDRQSAAVGGLIRNSSSTGYNRTPAGKGDPIISLLASKDFQRDQSQFVVFITPVIKTSASSGVEQVKKKFRLRE